MKSLRINDNQKKITMKEKAGGHRFYIDIPKYNEFGWDDDVKLSDIVNLVNEYGEIYLYDSSLDSLILFTNEMEKSDDTRRMVFSI